MPIKIIVVIQIQSKPNSFIFCRNIRSPHCREGIKCQSGLKTYKYNAKMPAECRLLLDLEACVTDVAL